MKASDLFVRCLEAEGVEYIFGIPGEENIDLMDSLSRSSIEFVVTRHEQGAAFMADAYGRVTGKPGVCLATLGPGATNLMTGVANAHLDRVPLVALTGQAELTRLHKESHQNVDTIQLFHGITKYNQPVVSAATIPEIIRKAFHLTTAGSPGAVHIQLPEDVAKEEVQERRPLPTAVQSMQLPDDQALLDAARLIENAARPVILAGNGVIRAQAWEALRALIDHTKLPMTNTFMAKGLLPFDHPQNLFTVGGTPYPPGLRPLHEADLVIAVGFDLVEYDPATWNEDSSRRVLYLHTIPAEVDVHFPIQLELVGNLPEMLRTLAGMVSPRSGSSAHDAIRARRLEELQSIPSPEETLPRQVMWHLSERLPKETIVISDVGLHKVWVSRWYQPKAPNRTLIYNGLAAMGGSLPGAIGAKLANPTDPVVVVSGDGGFLMNAQELETARRLNLAFTVIVFNDKRYSLIGKKQKAAGLAVTSIAFDNPDLRLFSQSFGVDHRKVDTAKGFAQALDEALESKRLNVIEVVLDREPF
ncbi:acetolactate synthase large subunit [Alicyclobacillus cycloheptanicus]|uniref:Acetolactate synthase-1/2/3 large subunit n=1 Tax=Alicyclobacillus cycloheptanicus TaxID=1457 RepID=A0ABT9XIQ3_9BACL|nr:acetolactate synthase large subunit [Alicyclobacillus cycloheptanicus]MDQ0190192.1 acetolactate synthase-1/2/3 large subunit [Alicyclobacillus cycloheptanicus]WDM02558.1 acetolactate synthase large subunit [Alicyclobacillus cycloheptanicus]